MHPIDIQSKEWILSSPNGKIAISLALTEEGRLEYQVSRDGETIFKNSPLGIKTSAADFTKDLIFVASSSAKIADYQPALTGKKRAYIGEANELTLKFRKKLHHVHIILRAYNDGIAYRYHIPGEGELRIQSEESAFRIGEDIIGWAHDWLPSYEGFYNKRTNEELLKGIFGMPVLLNKGSCWALVSEAGVYGHYCGSHIEGDDEAKLLKVVFAPDQKNEIITCRPFYTPWRAVILGSLADIIESTLIENLSPDSEIADTSWIKPGRAAWSWWSGDSTSDYDTQVKYVDFAHKMGWEYYLCDAGWQEAWLPELVEYAKSKGIGIFVWYHYKEVETDDEMLSKFSWLSSLGVKGVKVDFFKSDCQERIKIYDRIATVAAAYRLMVVYHGATKPAGEARRWPHIMTREGILGAEYYKWSEGPTAEHNCTVPFTRNAVGSMDYTPVTYSNNRGQTTWAHQTALAVVFESGVQHLADKPEAYEAIGDAIEFLKKCPAAWDDTKLIEGYPGSYITIARRSGENWFIGALCGGGTSRQAVIPLSFLEDGTVYTADIYRDGTTPEEIIHERREVTKSTVLKVDLSVNGGCAVSLIAK